MQSKGAGDTVPRGKRGERPISLPNALARAERLRGSALWKAISFAQKDMRLSGGHKGDFWVKLVQQARGPRVIEMGVCYKHGAEFFFRLRE